MAKINRFDINEIASAFEAFETDPTKRDEARFKAFLQAKGFDDSHADELFKYYSDRTHVLDLGAGHNVLNLKNHPNRSRLLKSAIVPTVILTPVANNLIGKFASESMVYGSKFLGMSVIGGVAETVLTFSVAGALTFATITGISAITKHISKTHQINKAKKHSKELIKALDQGKDLADISALQKLLKSLNKKTKMIQHFDNSKFPNWLNLPLALVRDGFLGINGLRDDLHELNRFAVELIKKVNGINGLSLEERIKPENVKRKAAYIKALNEINTFIKNDIQQYKLFAMLKSHKSSKTHIRNIDIYAILDDCAQKLINGYSITDKDLQGKNLTAKATHSTLVANNGSIPSLDAALANNAKIDTLLADLETKKSTLDDATYKSIASQILNGTIADATALSTALATGAKADLKTKVDAIPGLADSYKPVLKTAIDSGLITTESDLNAKAELLKAFDVTDLDSVSIKEVVKGIIDGTITDSTKLDDETKKQKLFSALRAIAGLDPSVSLTLENAIKNGKISSTTDLTNKSQLLIVLLNEKSNLDPSSYSNLRDEIVNGTITSDAELKAKIQNILIVRIPSMGLDPKQVQKLKDDITAGNTKSVASVIFKVNLLKKLEVEHASLKDVDFDTLTDEIINGTIADEPTLTGKINSLKTKTRDQLVDEQKARIQTETGDLGFSGIFVTYIKNNTSLDVISTADDFISCYANAKGVSNVAVAFLKEIIKNDSTITIVDALTKAKDRVALIDTNYNKIKTTIADPATATATAKAFVKFISKTDKMSEDVDAIAQRFIDLITILINLPAGTLKASNITNIKKLIYNATLDSVAKVNEAIAVCQATEKIETINKEFKDINNDVTSKFFNQLITERRAKPGIITLDEIDEILALSYHMSFKCGDWDSISSYLIKHIAKRPDLQTAYDANNTTNKPYRIIEEIINRINTSNTSKSALTSEPNLLVELSKKIELENATDSSKTGSVVYSKKTQAEIYTSLEKAIAGLGL